MRKLDKTQILSEIYKKWEEDLEDNNKQHPKYTDSKFRKKFYLDIVMNLFYIQNGLCAYTEQELCDEKFFKKENWQEEIYIFENTEFKGHLEHYDESLKSKNNQEGIKDWLWSNFFMAESDTNTKIKGRKAVEKDTNGKYILKPDATDYNEFELLEYDIKNNLFRANRKQPKEKRKQIDRMIKDVLGINYGVLPKKRSKIIKKHLNSIKVGDYTWNSIPHEEFPTATEMYKRIKIVT